MEEFSALHLPPQTAQSFTSGLPTENTNQTETPKVTDHVWQMICDLHILVWLICVLSFHRSKTLHTSGLFVWSSICTTDS